MNLNRRQVLLAAAFGCVATPVRAEFIPPRHRNIPRIEKRLEVWREHVRAQHDRLVHSRNPKIVAWRRANEAIPSEPEAVLVDRVNKLINRDIVYREDYDVWKTSDHWATILDALLRGGDCEDYALAKATSLRFHGWPESHYHLVIGNLQGGIEPIAHAVLVVERDDGTYWALDNLNDRVVPAEDMNMTPIYGVSVKGVWLFTRPMDRRS